MTLNLTLPDRQPDLKPRITVIGVGGAGGNAVNNMIDQNLDGCDFVVANTDSQALAQSRAPSKIQMGVRVTEGLGAGALPAVGASAAEESIEDIVDHLAGSHMTFITAGMGGGTGTGAAPIIAQAARELGVLTVGVVTKPFQFEGSKRMRQAEGGIENLQKVVDTLIIIPNQNLFRLANEKTTFTEAFALADDVLYQGVKGVTDLMVRPGLINLDFADVKAVMNEMGKAMMGTGESEGESRALQASEKAIANPLLDELSLRGARGILINVTGGYDLTLFELDEAANRIREEVDPDANIIVGSTLDTSMEGKMRVSVVATGIDADNDRHLGAPTHAFAAAPASVMPAAAPEPLDTLHHPDIPEDNIAAQEEHEDLNTDPSFFESFASNPDEADDMQDVEEPAADVPPPSYYSPNPPLEDTETSATMAEGGGGPRFSLTPGQSQKSVAPGTPSPETLARLRAAVEKEAPDASPKSAKEKSDQGEPSKKGRFGINSLIHRMTGQREDVTPPVERRHTPQRTTRDGNAVDPDRERIEVPAFLRRQAN